MSKYSPVTVEPSNEETEVPTELGGQGELLFKITGSVRWYLAASIFYTLAFLGFAVWTVRGPQTTDHNYVLQTGKIEVNQLHSGLALSFILTPAAVIIRMLSSDMSLLHPLAITSRTPVRLDDLDRMSLPGFGATRAAVKYSLWHAIVQASLLVSGAVLVPIGTLLITTQQYVPSAHSTGVVGMPTFPGSMEIMNYDMGCLSQGTNCTPTYDPTSGDFFMQSALDLFRGNIILQNGMFSATAENIGPIQTKNITYGTGIEYNGVVTYSWSSGCAVTDAIKFTVQDQEWGWLVNFTFPDGTLQSNLVNNASKPTLFMWSDAENRTDESNVPVGGTTYFALAGAQNSDAIIPGQNQSLTFADGVWVSRISCKPTISWSWNKCTWNGTTMTDCGPASSADNVTLDTLGLDLLSGYMTAVPWVVQNDDELLLGLFGLAASLLYNPSANVYDNVENYRAPTITDYEDMYGMVAQSLSLLSTCGYYGASEITTIGAAAQTVYVVRTYILVLVLVILGGVTLLSGGNLAYHRLAHLPLRRATFLTIANAVRGPWWDRELYGGCTMSPEQLRKRHMSTRVMFGVDSRARLHVGLAPDVQVIEKSATYLGIMRKCV